MTEAIIRPFLEIVYICIYYFEIPLSGALITVEAGGCVTSLTGEEFDFMDRGIIAAATSQLAEQIRDLIKVYKVQDRDFPDHCPL